MLLESKNGCLKSNLDVLTYISQPLTQIVLKKLDIDFDKKNALLTKILGSTLSLSNFNWVVTQNLTNYKFWLRTQGSKGQHTQILKNLADSAGFEDESAVLNTLLNGL
jgi:hypothetical protein